MHRPTSRTERSDTYWVRLHPRSTYADADIGVTVHRQIEPKSKTMVISMMGNNDHIRIDKPDDLRRAAKLLHDLFMKIADDMEG